MESQKHNCKNILDVLRELSDADFRQQVWVRGEGDRISSYAEAMCRLFDDCQFDAFLDGDWQFSDGLHSELRAVRSQLNEYSEKSTDEEILQDPVWQQLREFMGTVLKAFEDELILQFAERFGRQRFLESSGEIGPLIVFPPSDFSRSDYQVALWTLSSVDQDWAVASVWNALSQNGKGLILGGRSDSQALKRLAELIKLLDEQDCFSEFVEESVLSISGGDEVLGPLS